MAGHLELIATQAKKIATLEEDNKELIKLIEDVMKQNTNLQMQVEQGEERLKAMKADNKTLQDHLHEALAVSSEAGHEHDEAYVLAVVRPWRGSSELVLPAGSAPPAAPRAHARIAVPVMRRGVTRSVRPRSVAGIPVTTTNPTPTNTRDMAAGAGSSGIPTRIAANASSSATRSTNQTVIPAVAAVPVGQDALQMNFPPSRDASLSPDLLQAAYDGQAMDIHRLLSRGADITCRDGSDWTALHWGAFRNHELVVATLIAAGAPVDVRDRWGDTPLHNAARKGNNKVLLLLLEGGAAVDVVGHAGCTPLHLAARHGHKECLESLARSTRDINARDKNGDTALLKAAEYSHDRCVLVLLRAGADATLKNKQGETARDRTRDPDIKKRLP